MENKELELDEMKQQLRKLQERLNEQVEINDKQLRKALGQNISSLRSHDMVSVAFCFVVAFLLPFLVMAQGVSYTFVVATFVFLLANAICSVFLKLSNFPKDADLVTLASKVVKYKKYQRNYIFIGVPCAVVWGIFYFFELMGNLDFASTVTYVGFGIAMTIGAIVGFLIGYFRFYRPSMKKADRILSNIEDIKRA